MIYVNEINLSTVTISMILCLAYHLVGIMCDHETQSLQSINFKNSICKYNYNVCKPFSVPKPNKINMPNRTVTL